MGCRSSVFCREARACCWCDRPNLCHGGCQDVAKHLRFSHPNKPSLKCAHDLQACTESLPLCAAQCEQPSLPDYARAYHQGVLLLTDCFSQMQCCPEAPYVVQACLCVTIKLLHMNTRECGTSQELARPRTYVPRFDKDHSVGRQIGSCSKSG